MQRFDIKYIGARGEISLSTFPILYKTHDFNNSSISVTTHLGKDGFNSVTDRITTPSHQFTITLNIWKATSEDIINRLNALFNFDVFNDKPGKLYVGDAYINCFITSSTKVNWEKYRDYVVVELGVLALSPLWIKETVHAFGINNGSSDIGFRFPMSFQTYFVSRKKPNTINKPMYGRANLEIVFFGPTVNPYIEIDGYPFSVKTELLENERLTVNQLEKTVIKTTASGERVDMFDVRQKSPSMFQALDIKDGFVEYNSSFPLEITVYEMRAEPTWI